ncbi:MAG: cysteine desulfurase NifS [bacterium]
MRFEVKNIIYVDNNATTCVAPEVREAIQPYLGEKYGNPSSMYTFGGKIAKDIDLARQQVANLLGCNSQEIVFTSCGTESDNAAIRGTIESYPEKKHIITTRVEHPAILNVAKYVELRGYEVTYLEVDSSGQLDPEQLFKSLRKDTALVTIMWANNEIGNVFPVLEMGKAVKENGSVFHVDAVQAAGKIPINLKDSPIDLLSISGHKIHAPKGIGVLFVRRGTKFRPFMIGGHQEHGRRGGTENVPYIVGLGEACKLALANLEHENTEVRRMRDYLEKRILEEVEGASLNGDPDSRLPNTTNISFEFVEGEAILLMLDREGICASSGSACTSGSLEPSHVLRAMGVPFTKAHGSTRFSLSRYNKMKEMDRIIEVIKPAITRLREMSPGVEHMAKM